MRKHLKLFMLVMLICCTLTNIFGNNDVQAKEVSDNPYFIINGDTVVKEGENYYNEDTGGTESGTISGLKKGGKYYVEISTGQEVPGYYYLIGDGTVKS